MARKIAPAKLIKSHIEATLDQKAGEFDRVAAFVKMLAAVYAPDDPQSAEDYFDVLIAVYIEQRYFEMAGVAIDAKILGLARPSTIIATLVANIDLASDIESFGDVDSERRFVADVVRAFVTHKPESGQPKPSLNRVRSFAMLGDLFGHQKIGRTEFETRWRKFKDVCCILVVNQYSRFFKEIDFFNPELADQIDALVLNRNSLLAYYGQIRQITSQLLGVMDKQASRTMIADHVPSDVPPFALVLAPNRKAKTRSRSR